MKRKYVSPDMEIIHIKQGKVIMSSTCGNVFSEGYDPNDHLLPDGGHCNGVCPYDDDRSGT